VDLVVKAINELGEKAKSGTIRQTVNYLGLRE
jgi:hypothetical protein